METFGIYSLKAGIILTLFWGIYHLLLQKETFYRFNRFFLLTGIVAALVLPLITVHYAVEIKTSPLPFHLLTRSEEVSSAAKTDTSGVLVFLQWLLPVIYLTGIGALLTIRFWGLFRLFKTIRKNSYQSHTHFKLIESSDFKSAFSFFCFMCIPENLRETEKRIILRHEETHIRQKHWVDLLFMNMLSLLWWFNPIIWRYEKAIRNNHEYLADQAVLIDYKQIDYQQTLINQWFKMPVFPMANSFAYTNQLKRINMMKKNISNPTKKLFSLLAFPVIALFLWAFAEPEYILTEQQLYAQNETITDSIRSVVSEEAAIKVIDSKSPLPIENGTSNTSDRIVDLSFRYEGNAPLVIVDGKKEDQNINNINPDDIHSVNVLKDKMSTDKYGEEGINGVVEIITKKHAETNNLQLSEEPDIKVVGYEQTQKSVRQIETGKSPLAIINGKKSDQKIEDLDLNPEEIYSISVLKDQSAVDKYGEEGKNGVIEITTKKHAESNNLQLSEEQGIKILSFSTTNEVGRPLMIVDNKEVNSRIEDLDPKEIYSISVLKDKSCVDIYGEKGKTGVILITTKAGRANLIKTQGYEIN